jgi:hypothetical protein
MTALSVQPPFPILTDIDGQPLEDGFIFIGVVNLAPITNPITVYWDAALTIPAAQPIRTRGGYPINSGTPARLYVGSDYSIQVQNRNGSVVYTSLNGNAFFNSGGSITVNLTGTGSQTIFNLSSAPIDATSTFVFINGLVLTYTSDYTISGATLIFVSAPALNDEIVVKW